MIRMTIKNTMENQILRNDDGGKSPERDSRRLVGLKGNVRDSIVRRNRHESS